MTYRLKGASGELTGKTFELDEDTLIGSDPEADIRSDAFLPRHARIVFEDDTLMLESAGQTWINGEPAGRQPLQSGDELRVNRIRFVLQAPGLIEAGTRARSGRDIRRFTKVAVVVRAGWNSRLECCMVVIAGFGSGLGQLPGHDCSQSRPIGP